MSDLIEREDAIKTVANLMKNEDDWYREAFKSAIRTIPPARPKGEWAPVLAELHERFNALENELRKASAEMSAIIREYVDRPLGEWIDDDFVGQYRCSECDYYAIDEYDYCPNCGAKMKGADDE